MFSSLNSQQLFVWGGIALAVAAVLAAHATSRIRARRVVRGRSPLSAAEFSALFTTEAQAALGPIIRDCLRAYVPVKPALVRPDDKLCQELQLAVFDGIDANEFLGEVEKLVGVKIPDDDAQRMFTLRDIVSYVAARKHERAT